MSSSRRLHHVLLPLLLVAAAGCASHHPISERKTEKTFGEFLVVPNPDMVRVRKCSDGREWVRIDQSLAAGRRTTIWDASNGSLVWERDKKVLVQCLCLPIEKSETWGAEPALPAGCGDWVRDDSELDRLHTRFPKP